MAKFVFDHGNARNIQTSPGPLQKFLKMNRKSKKEKKKNKQKLTKNPLFCLFCFVLFLVLFLFCFVFYLFIFFLSDGLHQPPYLNLYDHPTIREGGGYFFRYNE